MQAGLDILHEKRQAFVDHPAGHSICRVYTLTKSCCCNKFLGLLSAASSLLEVQVELPVTVDTSEIKCWGFWLDNTNLTNKTGNLDDYRLTFPSTVLLLQVTLHMLASLTAVRATAAS